MLADSIRRHRTTTVALALVVLAAAALLVRGAGEGSPAAPATGAARLVPADALAYIHLSTDRNRAGVRRASRLLTRLPRVARVRDDLLTRLSTLSPGLNYQRDVRPWLGREAALALLNTAGTTAGTLIVADVADRGRAQTFLDRAAGPAGGSATYRGARVTGLGGLAAAFTGHYMVIGQAPSVRAALDLAAGRGRSLARVAAFRRATADLPSGRVLDAYAPPGGIDRLLAAQPGLLGVAGTLLQNSAAVGTALAVTARRGGGAQIFIHHALDRRRAAAATPPLFRPTLLDSVPADALAYMGLTRLDRTVSRLAAGTPAGTGVLGRLILRLGSVLATLQRRGVNVAGDLAPLFRREVALWLGPAPSGTYLAVVARAPDEAATREAFAALQAPLVRIFTPAASGPGQAPVFEERDIAGARAFSLRLAPGTELDYAVFDHKLVLSNSLEGIRRVRETGDPLTGIPAFRATLGDRPKRVTSLVFADFSQLLRLGERAGLSGSRAYQSVRSDLRRVRALGAAASAGEADSTTELFLQIS